MTNFELISFRNDSELAKGAAGEWLKEIASANRRAIPHCVALSGGRIARKFFSAVAELVKAQTVSFNSVHFFWADERCVPPDDAESNFRLARELLFVPLKISENQIHRVRGEDSPEAAAREAEAEVCRIAPLNADGQPVLGLIFLGMGEDGHVASLFPVESGEVMSSKAVYQAVKNSPKLPPNRVTLGYAAIAAARQVWVLASGAGKQTALRGSLSPTGQTPLARVLRIRHQTKIFTDILV